MAVPEEDLQKYKRAGKIAREIRTEIKKTVKEGMPIIDICEKVEGMTREKGGRPAFPCNVSINEIAAHYTSPPKDKRTIPDKGVVKVDIGVHIDGYIADTATTICLDPEHQGMVNTAEEALVRLNNGPYGRIDINITANNLELKVVTCTYCRHIQCLVS